MKLNAGIIWFFLIIIGGFQAKVRAYPLETQISILSPEKAIAKITGKLSESRKHWFFVDSYANADNLAARISGLQFFDERGNEVSFARLGAGEFETKTAASNFSYELKLDFPKRAVQSAHISWVTKEQGLLILGDSLPDFSDKTVAGKVTFVLPSNWKVATSENKTGENEFQTANATNAVFLVGDFSQQSSQFEKTQVNLARTEDWSFTSTEMLDLAASILAEHKKIFGLMPTDKIQLLLIPLPQKFGGEQWEAETRGSTVVLCAANIRFKSRALSKLHEQLRHELFHLWIPNNLNLTGDYAWFYEGFTLYQALKTGIRLKYIRFEDFLDALSRAFDAARFNQDGKNISLIEASRLRWRGNLSELVYAKGMTVAFICDLVLLKKTSGKKSLDSIFKELSRRSQKPNAAPEDANKAVLDFLESIPELGETIEKYVETPNEIDWNEDLAAAGLQNVSQTSLTKLAVSNRLTGRQKKLLARLVSASD